MSSEKFRQIGHTVLTDDPYCSGYIDQFGTWNTGFPCPSSENGQPSACCGAESIRYCCAKLQTALPSHASSFSTYALLFGVIVGVIVSVIFLFAFTCVRFSFCNFYKKTQPTREGLDYYTDNFSAEFQNVHSGTDFYGSPSYEETNQTSRLPSRFAPQNNSNGIHQNYSRIYSGRGSTISATICERSGGAPYPRIPFHYIPDTATMLDPPPPYSTSVVPSIQYQSGISSLNSKTLTRKISTLVCNSRELKRTTTIEDQSSIPSTSNSNQLVTLATNTLELRRATKQSCGTADINPVLIHGDLHHIQTLRRKYCQINSESDRILGLSNQD